MKFKFCSDGDCPLWALAGLHALSSLPAQVFRHLVQCVADERSFSATVPSDVAGNRYNHDVRIKEKYLKDDNIMDLLKETSLSSRDECARATAVIRWVLRQSWSGGCPGAQVTRDLLVLGVPRAHANALAEAVDEHREEYEANVKANGFMVNKVTDVSVNPGPEGTVDTFKMTFQIDDVFTGDHNRKELLIEKSQAQTLLEELKKAYQKMEELDCTNDN